MYISSGCQARHSRDSYWQNITATHSLQQTATHCNALQRIATHKCKCGTGCRYYAWHSRDSYWQNITATRSLQHTATHANVYQAADITRGIPVTRIEAYAYSFLDATGKLVCHDSLIYVSWLIDMCVVTHSYVWYGSSTCVTWLVLIPSLSLPWCDWRAGVSWLPHMCVMTPSYVCHESVICVSWFVYMYTVSWLIQIYTMAYSYVYHVAVCCAVAPRLTCLRGGKKRYLRFSFWCAYRNKVIS